MRQWLANPAGEFLEAVLRGIGQVMLQDNALTGLLFLLGIFVASWALGLYALFGTVVATLAAMALGVPRDDVGHGLYGFNGTLAALALAVYLQQGPALWVYVAIAAVFSTVVMAALAKALGAAGNALTAPFVVTAWIFVGAARFIASLHALPAPPAPQVLAGAAAAGAGFHLAIVAAIPNGVAQVMLLQSVWTGILFLIALAVNSWKSCAAAAAGSAIAAAVAWGLGAAPGAIHSGAYGFNAVLTVIAVGAVFFRPQRTTLLLALLAACMATILYAAWVALFRPLDIPVVTAPFVVITWLCLLAKGPLARRQARTCVLPD